MNHWITGLLGSGGLALVLSLVAFGLQSRQEGEPRASHWDWPRWGCLWWPSF